MGSVKTMQMTDRTTVVLYGAYERAFVSKAIAEGYVMIDTSYPLEPHELLELERDKWAQWEYETLYKYNPYKTAVLQMFLLFDKVILVGPELGYDWGKMEGTGLIEVVTADEQPLLLGQPAWGQGEWDQATKEYAMFLKPIVLNALVKDLDPPERQALRSGELRPRIFYSTIYDAIFSPTPPYVSQEMLPKIRSFFEAQAEQVHVKYKPSWEGLGLDEEYREELAMVTVKVAWEGLVMFAAGTLMSLLESSVLNNAVLVQNEFRMNGLELDSGVWQKADRDRLMDSYQILRLSVEALIGTLPRLQSLEDVLRLKDKRQRDIQRLRSVLNEIEHALREGKRQALNKAEREVRQASLELARGNTLDKVSKWTTYISLPVGIIEACFGFPPIAGLTLGFIGTATTLSADVAKAKNGWLQVVR